MTDHVFIKTERLQSYIHESLCFRNLYQSDDTFYSKKSDNHEDKQLTKWTLVRISYKPAATFLTVDIQDVVPVEPT